MTRIIIIKSDAFSQYNWWHTDISDISVDLMSFFQYPAAVNKGAAPLSKNQSSRSFFAFGFGAAGTPASTKEDALSNSSMSRRGSRVNVSIAPLSLENDTPEIRKYKKRFNTDILCASLWGKYIPPPLPPQHIMLYLSSPGRWGWNQAVLPLCCHH